jgi:carboxy-cis,cis-muconate cyclase
VTVRLLSPISSTTANSSCPARANSKDTNTRAIFLLAAQKAPYCVYGNTFYDHALYGNVFSVDPTGAIKENIQNYEYQSNSGIHGMVFDPSETYLYSADLRANKLWTHKKNDDGTLELVGSLDAPAPGDNPRWVEMHPSGNYLYALMEAGNRICEYVIDPKTHEPVYTHKSYPLVPPALFDPKAKMYRGDVVFMSQDGKYLFASTRSNSHSVTGYITAFRIAPAGNIERQLFLNPTPTSGGHSNAVTPCPWDSSYLALTDDQEGFVEIYKWQDEFLGRVAHLDIKEPGFGMNAIWYD